MDSTTSGATNPFADKHLDHTKHIVIVRHGQSTWNLEKRIQVQRQPACASQAVMRSTEQLA